MSNVATQLAVGYLPSAKGTLYTVPAGKKLLLSQIRYGININTTDEDVKFYLNISSVSYLAIQATLGANERGLETEMGNVLLAGDLIEGKTTTASKVPYWIFGALTNAD